MDKPCTVKVKNIMNTGRTKTTIDVAKDVKSAMKMMNHMAKAKIYKNA